MKSNFHVLSLGLHGHINPTLPVVSELVRRGERVTYHAPEEFQSEIEKTGCRFMPYRSSFLEGKPQKPMPNRLIEDVKHAMEQILPVISKEKPDVILYDAMCVAGRVLSEKFRLPSVRFVQGLALDMSTPFETDESFQKSVKELSMLYGVRSFDLGAVFTEPAPLNIVFTSRGFQPRSETFPDSFHFCGPQIEGGPSTHESLVYISLGTVFNDRLDFFKDCIGQLGNADFRVSMAVGSKIDITDLGPLPFNFQVKRHALQLEVLSKASVSVSHGGFNSIMESLYYGVPLVLFPQTEEQKLNAERVQELGAGLILENVLELEETILKVRRDSTGAALKLSLDLRATGGFQSAADAIQKIKGVSYAEVF